MHDSQFVFNQDGCGILEDLARTGMTEQDAADLLVKPAADSDLTAIDWCILTTGIHNCRTRHQRCPYGDRSDLFSTPYVNRVTRHYNAQPLDLLDIVVKHGHAAGLKVYGNLRLNTSTIPGQMDGIPGPSFNPPYIRKDFRSEAFHQYLTEIFEDLLEKGVDGISLDFERKTPFFPADATERQRFDACVAFLQRIRGLSDRTVIVRVAHDTSIGAWQGQDALRWMREGLVDVVVPATHNHEPDFLDWDCTAFVEAAKQSPRPCQVWPQIWPTEAAWKESQTSIHPPETVCQRVRQLMGQGADGVYFFNFFYYWPGHHLCVPQADLFQRLSSAGRPAVGSCER